MLTRMDLIWNRAALEEGGKDPGPGDRHLAALLYAHGLVMNGGVEHAIEYLEADELTEALAGYDYLGIHEMRSLFARAATVDNACLKPDEEEKYEQELADSYHRLVSSDSVLVRRFEKVLQQRPGDFVDLEPLSGHEDGGR